MRRYLAVLTILVALVAVAITQTTTSATQGADEMTYMPVVKLEPTPTPLPTNTPTITPSPSPTMIVGTGVFKKDGSTIYHPDAERYTGACGFIRFASGEPAYGGEEGFRAEFCLDSQPGYCHVSRPVDATGYYEVPMAIQQLTGTGEAFVLKGRLNEAERVSHAVRFDLDDVPEGGQGITMRIDFIECRQGDTSSACRPLTADSLVGADAEGYEITAQLVPDRFCPDR